MSLRKMNNTFISFKDAKAGIRPAQMLVAGPGFEDDR
jgi:hypothetical protein